MTSSDVLAPAPGAALRRGRFAAHPDAPLWVMSAAAFVVVLDFFIVNVALPSLRADLGASVGGLEWVVASYALALAAALVAGGRLGDRYGRRRVFFVGVAAFTVASAACGISPSTTTLVAGRIGQGLAAALVTPQILAIIGTVYDGPARVRALGVYSTVMGLAAVSGQLIGGALIALDLAGLGWRVCFLVNVPIGIVTLALTVRWVPESRVAHARRPDLAGSVLLALGLVALLLPLVEGRQQGWPAWTWACGVGAAVLAVAFVAQQRALGRRGEAPLIDRALVRSGAFRVGLSAQLALWCGQASFFVVLAVYLQEGRGLDALPAGGVFTVLAVAYVVAAALAPRGLARFGRAWVVEGGCLLALGHGSLALGVHAVGSDGSLWALVPGLVLVGAGMGICIPGVMGLALAQVGADQAGSAGGIFSTVQNVGNAVGVAVIGVVFFGGVDGGYGHAFGAAELGLCLVGVAVAGLALAWPRREREAQPR